MVELMAVQVACDLFCHLDIYLRYLFASVYIQRTVTLACPPTGGVTHSSGTAEVCCRAIAAYGGEFQVRYKIFNTYLTNEG